MNYQGRRRENQHPGELPDDIKPGDYWLIVCEDGTPLKVHNQSNLTGCIWGFHSPHHNGRIGTLRYHTVREHDDGTCSIRPGDGSSNSVLITGGKEDIFHGYLEHGVWSDI